MIAPLRAPQMLRVLPTPLQKAVAVLGSRSDSIPCASANHSNRAAIAFCSSRSFIYILPPNHRLSCSQQGICSRKNMHCQSI